MLLDESNFTNGLVPIVGLKLDKACFSADNAAHGRCYTVYKSRMLSVCKNTVILLCSLVNLSRNGQEAYRNIETTFDCSYIFLLLLGAWPVKLTLAMKIECTHATYCGTLYSSIETPIRKI